MTDHNYRKMHPSGPVSNRLSPRYKIFEPTTIHRPDGREQRAHLIDISTTGALIYSQPLPPVGEYLIVAIGKDRMEATVMRIDQGRIGVHFALHLNQSQVRLFLR